MKTKYYRALIAAVAIVAPTLSGHAGVAPVIVSEVTNSIAQRGPNHRVWQNVRTITNAFGQTVMKTNQAYVEVATGMHFLRNGQWTESKEQIDILPEGDAAATNGQHQAYFPSDIYNGVIELVTPDGAHLRSRPLGISYFDGNNSVLIAELTNSVGQILPAGNQVVYANAFTDFAADLRYTYTRAGFEQDVILRERPPAPEYFGLNPATTRLQILTEFFSPPAPKIVSINLPEQTGVPLQDEILDFGMVMRTGRASLLGNDPPVSGVLVGKQWLQLEGRQFLIEEAPVAALADQLQTLPPQIAQSHLRTNRYIASRKLSLPTRRMANNVIQKRIRTAHISSAPGLVLDYLTVNTNKTEYTFQSDTTYYISGAYYLNGTNTFEGGAVIKYTNNAALRASISDIPLVINWRANAYRPVIFTSMHDNSVGETISGSTGTPTNYYANPALEVIAADSTFSMAYFRISWAKQALSLTSVGPNFSHGQILNCQNGISFGGTSPTLRNLLFAGVRTNFNSIQGATLKPQNVTFSDSDCLAGPPYSGSSLALTNCILANVVRLTNGTFTVTGSYNGFYSSPDFGTPKKIVLTTPFQSVGAGYFYLTDESQYRNAGTPDVDPTLLTDLGTKTTYPPIIPAVPGAYRSTDLNLFPQAQRDTDIPDLGYHYDPLDYAFGVVNVTNAILTINPGTVIAAFSTNTDVQHGLAIGINGQLFCQGTADHPNRIVAFNMVQEQTTSGWLKPGGGLLNAIGGSSALCCRFTDFSVPAQDDYLFQVNSAGFTINLQDCQFHGGKMTVLTRTVNLTNCLLERVNADLEPDDDTPAVRNNLIWRGTFLFAPTQTNSIIKDNLFDQATIPNYILIFGNTYNGGYNAYVTGYDRLQPTNAADVILSASPVYQIGPLGNYYLPTNSTTLINHGSVTNAALAGFYHFTTTTNQVKEATSPLDIGYHYVALNSGGNANDADTDGIPDYLEDANGDGSPSSGETDWNSPTDLGLKVIITRPRNGSTIP